MKTSFSPAKVYTALVRRLHFLLLLAALVPMFCQIITSGMSPQQAAEAFACFMPLYILTLTIAFPASFMYLIQEKVKGLGTFLLCACPVCVLYLAGLFSLQNATGISVLGSEQVPQALILLTYLLDAIRMRTNDNSRRKAKEQEDHSWKGDFYLLPLPSLAILVPFAVVYTAALFLHSNELAQVCLVGAILYFFVILPYHMLVRREEFLQSRHSVSRIPKRQIARLQRASLLLVMIPCALIAAAALMTAGGRHYLDLPTFGFERLISPERSLYFEKNYLLRILLALGYLQRGSPPPQWLVSLLDFIENALTVLLTALLFYAVWLGLRSLALRFRRNGKEDTVQHAVRERKDEHVSLKESRRPDRTPRAGSGIRRRYRRIILRFRGAPPELYETPTLMEKRSRLPDTPAMHALHDDYERERYGNHYTG